VPVAVNGAIVAPHLTEEFATLIVKPRVPFVLVGVLLAGFALAACGGGDEPVGDQPVGDQAVRNEIVEAVDPLAQAIADDVVADLGSPFEGDRASADCFAIEIVGAIGSDRLAELGFSVESIPNELHTDWTAEEVDVIIGRFEGCVDVAALTETTVATVMSGEDVDCVLAEIGDQFYLEVLRAQLVAGSDEAATQAAAETATEPFSAAVDICGEAGFGDGGDVPSTSDGDPAGGEPDPSALSEAPAPLGLDAARLPEDSEAVDVLFDALPTELLGGIRSIESSGSGQASVVYESTARTCAESTLQAVDLSVVGDRFYPPGWTAEWEVAVFATGADWEVEAAGRDGGLVWATWHTTCGGVGVEDSEVYAATWGTGDSSWVFSAVSLDAAGRDALIAAFVAAAPTRDSAENADDRQARQALLRLSDLGSAWSSQPRFVEDDPEGDAIMEAVVEAEPACTAAVERAAREDVPLSELIDALLVDAPVRAESPTYLYRQDGTSEVEHTVSVLTDGDQVAVVVGLFRELDWTGCMRAAFDDLMMAAFDADDLSVAITDYSATESPVGVGDDGIGVRIALTVEPSQGASADFTFDFSFVAVGRALSAVTQISLDGAIDDLDAVAELAHQKVEAIFG
jgi:hypothetical protein